MIQDRTVGQGPTVGQGRTVIQDRTVGQGPTVGQGRTVIQDRTVGQGRVADSDRAADPAAGRAVRMTGPGASARAKR
ncbi:hypothetical protein CA983_39015 [Streptomyces swartbergensis]|uniref:Uncharacterized protein n=1 Tax=Streptomyces swartbergensis TaxID=487165 RepID=A0A243RB38_9ACTN|nr:hypothetical protein CA983_39015 [Streptomyces swartbergensis]